MRSTYYPGVCTKPVTYYQGWFMYMRYVQGQNEDFAATFPSLWYDLQFCALEVPDLGQISSLECQTPLIWL